MIRRSPDLLLILALAWLAWTLALLDGPAWLRAIAGLPMVLFFPGYALLAAVYPRRAIDGPERLVLGIALSLAVVVLTGVLLHLSGSGLSPAAWASSLSLVTGPAAAVAMARREAYALEAAPPGLRKGGPLEALRTAPRSLLGPAALLLVSGILVAVSVLVSQRPSPQQDLHGYTQLWIMPAGETPEPAVWVGLTSHEFEARTFQLAVEADGHHWYTFETVELVPGEVWYSLVMLPPDWDGSGAVVARLSPVGEPETVYREVILGGRPPVVERPDIGGGQ